MDIGELIDALSRPAAYPDAPVAVAVRQTHISAVFLAGEHVYKVKKPVSPGFLDFTTLDKRRRACDDEVRLNRRLAPGVYLGVVPIVRSLGGLRVEGEGEAVEWAVKMRRLPDEAAVEARLRRGEVCAELAGALARRIAAFHRAAESIEAMVAFGRFDAVARSVREVVAPAGSRLLALAEEALATLRPVIDGRAARGMTRDCHGDLRLDHIYVFPDAPPPDDLVVIDCIEFNERFRYLDPVADMAFLVMDFAFHGRRDLARAFAEAYFRASGDDEGRALLSLYTAYRAAVRAMVEDRLAAESEVPAEQRQAARRRAGAHRLLALAQLEPPARRPCLVLVGGLPGVGKTRLATGLASAVGLHLVRADVVRKELAALPVDQRTPAELQGMMYSPEERERAYAECLRRAEERLAAGERVIVEATFREERQRRAFLEMAARSGVVACLLVCRADEETIRRRLEARRGDASDADWATYQMLAREWEGPSEATRRQFHEVDTGGTPEQALDRATAVLRDDGLWSE